MAYNSGPYRQVTGESLHPGVAAPKSNLIRVGQITIGLGGNPSDVIAAPAVMKVGAGKDAKLHIIRPGPREIKRRLNFPETRKSGQSGVRNRPINLGNVSDQAGQEAALAVGATSLTGAPASQVSKRVTPLKIAASVGGLGVGLWGILALL